MNKQDHSMHKKCRDLLLFFLIAAAVTLGGTAAAMSPEKAFKNAITEYKSGKYSEAAGNFQTAYKGFHDKNNQSKAAEASYNEGLCLSKIINEDPGNINNSITAFLNAAESYSKSDNLKGEANSRIKAAQLFLRDLKFLQASTEYKKVLDISGKNTLFRGLAHEGLGKAATKQGQLGEAEFHFQIAEKGLVTIPTAKLRVLLQHGACLRKIGNMKQAMEIFDEVYQNALNLYENPKTKPIGQIMAFLSLAEKGHTATQLGWYQQAKTYFEEALALGEKSSSVTDSLSLQVEGNLLVTQGQLGDVFGTVKIFPDFIERARENSLKELECTSLLSLARLLRIDGKYGEALERYMEARTLAENEGLKNRYIQCIINIGDLYYELGMWSESKNNYQLAFNRAIEQGDMESTLVSIMGIFRVRRGNELGLSGKVDYRVLRGMPWKGSLEDSGRNIEALKRSWMAQEEIASSFFQPSSTLNMFHVVRSVANMNEWTRIQGMSQYYISDGTFRLSKIRIETAKKATKSLNELMAGRDSARNQTLWNLARDTLWGVLRKSAGESLLEGCISPVIVSIDGIQMEGDTTSPVKNDDKEFSLLTKDVSLLSSLGQYINLVQKPSKQLNRTFLSGEEMPFEIRENLLRSGLSSAQTRAEQMVVLLKNPDDNEKAISCYEDVIQKILLMVDSSSFHELDEAVDLKGYASSLSKRAKEGLGLVAHRLVSKITPSIVYRIIEAEKIASIESAWERMQLRIALLKELGIEVQTSDSWENTLNSISKAIQRGSSVFKENYSSVPNDGAEVSDKAEQLLQIARKLVTVQLSSEKRACSVLIDRDDNRSLGFDDSLEMEELIARLDLMNGDTVLAENRSEKIRTTLGVPRRNIEGVPNPELIWRSLYISAEVSLSEGNFEQALQDFRASISVMEQINPTEGSNSQMTSDRLKVYQKAIELLFTKWDRTHSVEDSSELWYTLERMKSRQWREMLSRTGASFLNRMSEEERKEYRLLKGKITLLEGGIRYACFRGNIENMNNYSIELQKTRFRLNSLISEYTADVPMDIPDSEKISSMIPDDWAVVNYFISPELSFAIILRSEQNPEVVHLPLDYDSLFGFVLWWRTHDKDGEEFGDTFSNSDSPNRMICGMTGQTVCNNLFRPVADKLSNIRNVLIIPHDILHVLPLDAMSFKDEEGDNHYLIEEWKFAELPSAFLLSNRDYSFDKMADELIVIANPEYYPTMVETRGRAEASTIVGKTENPINRQIRKSFCRSIKPLYGSQVEADILREIWCADGSFSEGLLQGKAAEKYIYDRKANNYRYVHFACHGYDRNTIPDLQPGLVLSPAEDIENDSFLQMGELACIPWNSELVVLSACDTGLGDLYIGDGMIGLNSVFLSGGAKGVIVSLWRVPDISVPEFMRVMYSKIREGGKPCDAVREAKLHLLMNTEYCQANYWAVFKYVGIPW